MIQSGQSSLYAAHFWDVTKFILSTETTRLMKNSSKRTKILKEARNKNRMQRDAELEL